MFFSDLTDLSAEAYLHHVVARGPARLRDLAVNMFETGGPIDLMDGSLESLVPYWRWFLERAQAGFPEIPSGALSSRAIILRTDVESDQVGRALYASEPIAHYLLEVIRTLSPDAHWDLFPKMSVAAELDQTSVIRSKRWDWVDAERIVFSWSASVARGDWPAAKRPEGLLTGVAKVLGIASSPPAHAGSLLKPLLELDATPLDDPVRVTPRGVLKEHRFNAEIESWSDQGLIFADPRLDIESPENAPTVDEDALARQLTNLGAHIDGRPVTGDNLRDQSGEIVMGESIILLDPVVEKGRLRLLAIHPTQLTEMQWGQFETGLTRVGQQFGWRLGDSSDFSGHVD